MVQVFSPSPREMQAGQIGQALGMGINKNFEDPQQKLQRSLLQEGMSKISNMAKDPNTQPMDLLTNSLSAIAGIPGAERYAMPLIEKIMSMQAYKQTINDQNASVNPQDQTQQEQPQGRQQQTQGGQQPQQGQQNNQAQTDDSTPLSLASFIPVDLGSYISPQQATRMIEGVGKSGGDVNHVKQRIKDYNDGIITYNELLNSNVSKEYAQQQKQLKLESNALNYLDSQLSPDTSPDEKSMAWELMKPELKKSGDFTSAYRKIQPKYQSLKKQLNELPNKIPKSSSFFNYGMSEANENTLRSATKNIMENYPEGYGILESMFTKKGQPITQTARILNQLKPPIKKIMIGVTDYKPEIYPSYIRDSNDMLKNIENVQQKQSKSVPKIAKDLSSNWDDRVSLINVYTDLKVKGWFPEQIYQLFDQLQEDGVEFSPQQLTEKTQLAQPPEIPIRFLSK